MSVGRFSGFQTAKDKINSKELNCLIIPKHTLDFNYESLINSNINNNLYLSRNDSLDNLFLGLTGEKQEVISCKLKIKLLINFYFEIHFNKLDKVNVKFYTTESPDCTKYHIDYVGLRLITTFVGPTTNVLHNQYVKKENENISFIDRPVSIFPGDVLLMKGKNWPENENNAVYHKSPNSNLKRLIFSIDDMKKI